MEFLVIPPEIWRLRLDPIRAVLLALIHNFEECFMSNETLAREINVSKRTIQYALNELEEVGLVERSESKVHKTGRILRSSLPPVDNSGVDPRNICAPPSNICAPTRTVCAPPTQNLRPPHAKSAHNEETIKETIKERERADAPLPPVDNFSVSEIDLKNQGSKADGVATRKKSKKGTLSLGSYTLSPDQKQALDRWIEFRAQAKKPLTQITLDAQIKKWGEQLPAVIAQSIEHGWQGLFELKQRTGTNGIGDKATQVYARLSAAATKQDKAELNRLCDADPRIVKAIESQGLKPKTWLLKHLELANDYARRADREAFVLAYNSVSEGN